ncbi:MAG: DUF2919 family protein [Aestuariibacter sp.]
MLKIAHKAEIITACPNKNVDFVSDKTPIPTKKHAFSLDYYDNDGLLKPPVLIYVILFYLFRAVVIIAAASGIGSDTSAILSAVYPDLRFLYIHTGIALLACGCGYLVFYRRTLLEREKLHWLRILRPGLIIILMLDLSLHLYIAYTQHWQFAWSIGIGVFIPLFFLLLLIKNTHVRVFCTPEYHHR